MTSVGDNVVNLKPSFIAEVMENGAIALEKSCKSSNCVI